MNDYDHKEVVSRAMGMLLSKIKPTTPGQEVRIQNVDFTDFEQYLGELIKYYGDTRVIQAQNSGKVMYQMGMSDGVRKMTDLVETYHNKYIKELKADGMGRENYWEIDRHLNEVSLVRAICKEIINDNG